MEIEHQFKPAITLETLVEAIKADVTKLVRDRVIPSTVQSFSELHDYCDANCLGGLCDPDRFASLLGDREDGSGDGSIADGMIAIINSAQTSVNTWLANGELRRLVDLKVAEL